MALFPEGNRLDDGNNFVLTTTVLILNSIHKDFRAMICRPLCFFMQLSKTSHEFASVSTVSGFHLTTYSWQHFLFPFDIFNTRVHPLVQNYAFKLNLILNSPKAKRSLLFKPVQICRISLSEKNKKIKKIDSHLFIFFPTLTKPKKNILSTTVSTASSSAGLQCCKTREILTLLSHQHHWYHCPRYHATSSLYYWKLLEEGHGTISPTRNDPPRAVKSPSS